MGESLSAPLTPQTNTNMKHKRKPGYWADIWKRYPERQRANLEMLNAQQLQKVDEKVRQFRGIQNLMPKKQLPPCVMRDHIAEAWGDVYNEELTNQQAWNWCRFAIRQNVIKKHINGMYEFLA